MLATTALILMLGAAPAANDESEAGRAKQAFQLAERHYAQGLYAEAIDKFQEAYRLKPHPSIFFNLGRCYERLNDGPNALRNYREYLKALPEARNRQVVIDAIATIERSSRQRQPLQQLTLVTEPPGASVTIDGKPFGSAPMSIELGPGNHLVTLKKQLFVTLERSFVMPSDKPLELSLALEPEAAPPPRVAVDPAVPAEPPAVGGEEEAPVRASGPVFTALGGGDVLARSVGAELGAGYHFRALELTARVRFGPAVGVGLRAVYGLNVGPTVLFAGIRGDAHPSAAAYGAGALVGVRVPIAAGFGAVGEICGQYFVASPEYRPTSVLLMAGVDWR